MTVNKKPGRQIRITTDNQQWNAVVNRNIDANGTFVYAVTTTGIYCRNTCPARLPFRKHVRFFPTCQQAEAAGFRACKRSRPDDDTFVEKHATLVTKACRLMDQSDLSPGLDELAGKLKISPSHLHRLFKAHAGITPKQYAVAIRTERVRSALKTSKSVTEAIYRSGYRSNGRFYASSTDALGMQPLTFRKGGNGETIRYAILKSSLGGILVASSAKGICAILLGDHENQLVRELEIRFPSAELIRSGREFENTVRQVVQLVENPTMAIPLPLDIRGTSFQQRVWKALMTIPPGTKVSYTELAQKLGQPKAVRAVASACAANVLAIAIPCHRVVRQDGELAGYRWGIDRKRELIQRESAGR